MHMHWGLNTNKVNTTRTSGHTDARQTYKVNCRQTETHTWVIHMHIHINSKISRKSLTRLRKSLSTSVHDCGHLDYGGA